MDHLEKLISYHSDLQSGNLRPVMVKKLMEKHAGVWVSGLSGELKVVTLILPRKTEKPYRN